MAFLGREKPVVTALLMNVRLICHALQAALSMNVRLTCHVCNLL